MRIVPLIAGLGLLLQGAAHAATISGAVTRSDNAAAIPSASVTVIDADSTDVAAQVQTDAAGNYQATVPAGNFAVLVEAAGFRAELFDNVPCVGDTCDFGQADLVTLTALQTRNDVHFALDRLGAVTGTVRRSGNNAPLAGIKVAAYVFGQLGSNVAQATTNAQGQYQLDLPNGSYRVQTEQSATFFDEAWQNIPCNFYGCNLNAITAVVVQNSGTVASIDFTLDPGASLSGNVRRASDAAPVDVPTEVEIFDGPSNPLGTANVAPDGSWSTPIPLLPGTFRLVARPATRYFHQVYNLKNCGGTGGNDCDIAGGNGIVVSATAAIGNLDFSLARRTGLLEGHVARHDDATPIAGVEMRAMAEGEDDPVATTTTDGSGDYSLEVTAGTYTLVALPPPAPPPLAGKHGEGDTLLPELYPGRQCPGVPVGCAGEPTPIVVAASQTVGNLDFALAPAAMVTIGLRNASTNALVAGELALLYPDATTPASAMVTGGTATEVPVLNGGDFRFAGGSAQCGAQQNQVCLAERYPNDPCPGLACELVAGQAIQVAKGGHVSGIELVLAPGRTIAGTVRNAADNVPLSGIVVEISTGDVLVTTATTLVDGTYAAAGLGVGPYFARTRAPSGFIDQLFQGMACPPGACTAATGTPLSPPPAGQILGGIDFSLTAGAGIRGVVKSDANLQNISGAEITIFNASGTQVGTANSLGDGSFTSPALPPGNYFVRASATGYATQLWEEFPCPGGTCDPLDGTAVPVAAPDDTVGVDFFLDPDATNVPPRSTIYLNRCAGGCTVTGGFNSSVNNTSSIVSGTRNLSGFGGTDATFNGVVACVREVFAPFNVEITTTNPGAAVHTEAIISVNPGEAGFHAGTGGVSPFTCGVLRNTIVFAFDFGSNDIEELCHTVSQELGHSMGLDHGFHCPDPMTYLLGCGPKRFRDEDVQCGEYSARPCVCGGSTQNSYKRLLGVLGESPAVFADGFENPPAAQAKSDGAPDRAFQCETALPVASPWSAPPGLFER